MSEQLVESVVAAVCDAARLYQRLALLVGPAGVGKTAVLQAVSDRTGAALINLNLELSRRLLELSARDRVLQLYATLADVIRESPTDVVLLDNIEMLFDVTLEQDPLRLLQSLARQKTVVAAWNGCVEGGRLTYAAPEHAEYRSFRASGLLVVDAARDRIGRA